MVKNQRRSAPSPRRGAGSPSLTPPSEGHSWRVRWHRSGWAGHVKSKGFEREVDMLAFVAKLRGDARDDLDELDLLQVLRRPVGEWEAVST